MKIKTISTKTGHLTATEKKHIKVLFEKELFDGYKVNTKTYEIKETETGYSVAISQNAYSESAGMVVASYEKHTATFTATLEQIAEEQLEAEGKPNAETEALTEDTETENVQYKPLDKKTAHQAHAGTSFDPEKRGDSEIENHKNTFKELTQVLGDFFRQKHADKLHELWTAYLYSHAAVMSTMITGPANFPTDRNRKRSGWADSKRNAIYEYCDNLKKWKLKADKKKYIAEAGGELAVAKADLESAIDHHGKMKDVNKILLSAPKYQITEEKRRSFRVLDIDPKLFNPETGENRYGDLGFADFHLTNSNARIKGKAAKVAKLELIEANRANGKEDDVFSIEGGTVTYNYTSDRINVRHDEKPGQEIIALIKKNGFRWSGRYKTWTRKMTANAKRSAEKLIELIG